MLSRGMPQMGLQSKIGTVALAVSLLALLFSAMSTNTECARADESCSVGDDMRALGTLIGEDGVQTNAASLIRGYDHVVAASDSGAKWREQADSTADGADDHVEINAAIAGGGDILLAPGNYSAGATVLIATGNTTLTLSASSTVSAASGFSGDLLTIGSETNSDITFSDVTVRGGVWDAANNASDGIHMADGAGSITRITVEDTTIRNTTSQGIHIQNLGPEHWIRNVVIEDTGADGILWTVTDHVQVIGSTLRNIDTAGAQDAIEPSNTSRHFRIADNEVETVGGSCVDMFNTAFPGIVANNIFTECGQDGAAAAIANGNATEPGQKDLTITGNYIEAPGSDGIEFPSIATDHKNITIQGNVVVGPSPVVAGASGILTSGGTQFTVSGNTVSGFGGTGIQVSTSETTIANNVVDSNNQDDANNQAGIFISNNGDDVTVIGNQVTSNSNRGIMTGTGTARAVISYNNVEGTSSSGGSFPILSQGTNALIVGNKISGGAGRLSLANGSGQHILMNHMDADLNSASNAALFRSNRGYTTENSGTGSVASAATTTTITHGLDETPSAQDCQVTPNTSLASASEFWADTFGATEFTVHLDTTPGSQVDLAWSCQVLN